LQVTGSNSGALPLVNLVASGTGTFQRGVRLLNSGMNAGDHIMMSVGQADGARNMGQFYFQYNGSGSTSNRLSLGLHSVDDVLNILGTGNVGIGTITPQKPLEVISNINDFVSVGVAQMGIGQWAGIHFGYRESNPSYRKSAIVFERTDLTANDAQGKIHILNGPQGSAGSATLANARLTIAENGDVRINHTIDFSATFSVRKATGRNIANFSNQVDADLNFTTSEPGAGTRFARITPSVSGQQIELGLNNNNVLIGTTTDNGNKLRVNGVGFFDSGVRTGQPFGTTTNYWLLGRALVSGTSTPDRWIRVQIGLEYYDILAVYMGTVPT
jgi:hypothetical protein